MDRDPPRCSTPRRLSARSPAKLRPWVRASARGSIRHNRLRRSDQESGRGRGLRGGRSGGDVLCRGRDEERSTSPSGESGPSQQGATIVQHQGSLLTGEDGAGACGKPRRCEQDGPEHGKSRRGPEGAESAGPAAEYRSTSRSESDSRADRLRFEVTPWPQAARADEGAKASTTRSMQNAPASQYFGRSRNEETIWTRVGQRPTTWELVKRLPGE